MNIQARDTIETNRGTVYRNKKMGLCHEDQIAHMEHTQPNVADARDRPVVSHDAEFAGLARANRETSHEWDYGAFSTIGARVVKQPNRLVPTMHGRTHSDTDPVGGGGVGITKRQPKKRGRPAKVTAAAPVCAVDAPDGDLHDGRGATTGTEVSDDHGGLCDLPVDNQTPDASSRKKGARRTHVTVASNISEVAVAAAVTEALHQERTREMNRQRAELTKDRRALDEARVEVMRMEVELRAREAVQTRLCEENKQAEIELKAKKERAERRAQRILSKAVKQSAANSEVGELVCGVCKELCGAYKETTQYMGMCGDELGFVELRGKCMMCYKEHLISDFYSLTCTHAACSKCTMELHKIWIDRKAFLDKEHDAIDQKERDFRTAGGGPPRV